MTTRTMPHPNAPQPLYDPLDAVAIEHQAAASTYAAARHRAAELREEARNAERDEEAAGTRIKAATARALLILRALVNRDETEPTAVVGKDYEGLTVEYRAALGRVNVHIRRGTRTAAPRWVAFGWRYGTDNNAGETVYEPPMGSNDPDKLAAQGVAAEAAARAWLQPLTGAAWLAAEGLAAVEPVDLLTVEGYATQGHERGAYSPSATISIGRTMDNGVQLAKIDGYDLGYGLGNERRPALSQRQAAELVALTRGNVPIVDLRPDLPAERERRIEAIRALIRRNGRHIAATWLEGFRIDGTPR